VSCCPMHRERAEATALERKEQTVVFVDRSYPLVGIFEFDGDFWFVRFLPVGQESCADGWPCRGLNCSPEIEEYDSSTH
jgi:hypothetical protein